MNTCVDASHGGSTPHRILIVDTDDRDSAAMAEAVARAGRHVTVVSNGIAVLACLPLQVDLLIINPSLPDSDGFAIMRTLRQIDAATRILAVCSLFMHFDPARTARLMGAHDVLYKPVDHERLRSLVEDLLSGCDAVRP